MPSSARVVTTVAVAALIGTVVGGASAVSVVMSVMQPANHDSRIDVDRADAGRGGAAPAQASTDPQPQSAPPATAQVAPPVQGPGKAWPDALSARNDRDTATASTTSAPVPPSQPQSSPDAAASRSNGAQSSDQLAAQDRGAPTGAASVAERAPWPTPLSPAAKAARKHAATGSESVPPPAAAEPAAPASAATADNAPPSTSTATNKMSGSTRKSRLARQQQRSPDDADQYGEDRPPIAVAPGQRVIVLPAPQQRAASTDRDHWDRGPVRLFDFSGGDRWNSDRPGNSGWGWHDDDRN